MYLNIVSCNTYVLFQICDVFPVLRQGLKDFQSVREVFIAWLVVSNHLKKVGSQRAKSLTLKIKNTFKKSQDLHTFCVFLCVSYLCIPVLV